MFSIFADWPQPHYEFRDIAIGAIVLVIIIFLLARDSGKITVKQRLKDPAFWLMVVPVVLVVLLGLLLMIFSFFD